MSPEGFLLVEQAQAESNTVSSFCLLRQVPNATLLVLKDLQVKTSSWLGGNLLVALASQARRQQVPKIT